jgi:hypothetical protein
LGVQSMLFALVYLALRRLLKLAAGPAGEEQSKDVEILVLRHQLKVLRRKVGRPRLRRLDRALLAAANKALRSPSPLSFVVSPQTLLRARDEQAKPEPQSVRLPRGLPPLHRPCGGLPLPGGASGGPGSALGRGGTAPHGPAHRGGVWRQPVREGRDLFSFLPAADLRGGAESNDWTARLMRAGTPPAVRAERQIGGRPRHLSLTPTNRRVRGRWPCHGAPSVSPSRRWLSLARCRGTLAVHRLGPQAMPVAPARNAVGPVWKRAERRPRTSVKKPAPLSSRRLRG